MDIQEIKSYAKIRAEEDILGLFGVYMIYFIYQIAFPFHYFFFCIEPGFYYYMVRYINDKSVYLADIFRYIENMWEFFITGFLRRIITFFSTLVFIVPGIYAHYKYALVPLILTDPKLKEARGMECLKLSSDMMSGHIFECFLLDLSFLYLHLLAIPTLGFLEVYIKPYQMCAKCKLLYEIKKNYMGEEPSYMLESDATYTPVGIIKKKESTAIAISTDTEGKFKAKFCMNCGRILPPNSVTCLYCGHVYKEEKDSR